ncbi:radical SAM protein [Candidatus Aerophobetes bacterium Ae_b3a]|nr:MAG: radical SAM protein [Candidatus Aerophobetes bacterium Ae_b3a]
MDITYLIRFFLKNEINRCAFSLFARKNKNGRSALEGIFSLYTNEDDHLSLLEKLEIFPFYLFFESGRILFKQTKEEVKKELNSPAIQKAVSLTMRSVAHYGLTYPQKFVAPPVVVWDFTNICNLKCKHCYQNAGKKLPQELPLSKRIDIINQLAKEEVFIIAFSGGEPLMDKDLWPAIEKVKKENMYVSIATNGTLITEEVARRMATVGVDYVEISLDSVHPEKHDGFRGIPGAWKKAVRGIKKAVAQKAYQVGLASTITKMNFNELEDLIEFSISLRTDKFFAFNFIPVGEGKNLIGLDLTPSMREKMLNTLYEYYLKKGTATLTSCPQYARVCMNKSQGEFTASSHYSMSKGDKTRLLAEFIGGCGVGRAYCAIQPDGIVTPCVYMPIEVGDLKKQTFKEIWNNSSVLEELRSREDLKEHCGICEHRAACGGCRARAYAYFGDLKAPDPGCINNHKAFLQLEKTKDTKRPTLSQSLT